MATTMLIAAGACFTSGAFNICVLQPSECSDEQVFHSSNWLATNDNVASSTCSDQDNIRKLQSLGRCDGQADRYICTSHKTACRFSAVYDPFVTSCDLVHDNDGSNDFSNSHFGFCEYEGDEGKSDFCTWSFAECGGDSQIYEWNIADPFFANQNPDCHCDDVRTGACYDASTNEMYCAVAADVCDGELPETYFNVLDLESSLDTSCYLCDVLSAEDLENTTPDDEGEGSDDLLDDGGGENSSSSNNGNEMGTAGIVAIAIASVMSVAAVFCAGVLYFVRARNKRLDVMSETLRPGETLRVEADVAGL